MAALREAGLQEHGAAARRGQGRSGGGAQGGEGKSTRILKSEARALRTDDTPP
ncbi:hypothetical protein ACFWG6_04505 [Streptomyces erythrochromogenes]|uniref:hypothetical protein n=1 Tax=Streptomyces erythrochromogenes TaxID=285574 RepID=UPI00225A88BF|nr:hypothetical protein [Streptomyces erythrochromogenes]MCX5585368.1 hypothetical protein [Streptomyces erythrochromogenes]